MRYTYKSPTYIISCFIYKYIVDQYPTKAGTAWAHLHLRFFSDTVQYYKCIFSHDLQQSLPWLPISSAQSATHTQTRCSSTVHVVCKASLTGGVLVVKFLERWLCRGQCSECPCCLRVSCVCSLKEPVGLVPHLQRMGTCDVGASNISRAVVLIWIQRPGAAAGPEEPATHPVRTAPG